MGVEFPVKFKNWQMLPSIFSGIREGGFPLSGKFTNFPFSFEQQRVGDVFL